MIYLIIIILIIIIIVFLSSKLDVKFRGIKTTGAVIDVRSQTWTDQYGVAHTNYFILYEFYDRKGQRWTGEKKVNSNRISIGDTSTVYYLSKRPQRNIADF